MARRPVKARQAALSTNILHKEILDLFLYGYSPTEIATKLGTSDVTVQTVIGNAERHVGAEMAALAERVMYVNLARTQRLFSKYMAQAEDGDLKSARFILDLIKLQVDIASKTQPKADHLGTTINIERFEQTITSSNPLYTIANDQITDGTWIDKADIPVSDIYDKSAVVPSAYEEELKKLEEKFGSESLRADDDNT